MTAREPKACEHCSLPAGAGGVTRNWEGAERSFCCLGCSIAWKIAGPGGRAGGGESSVFLVRICLGFVLTMIVMLIQWVRYFDPAAAASADYEAFAPIAEWIAATPVLLVLGVPYLWSAAQALRSFRVGADLLVGLGIVCGYGASIVTIARGEADPLFFDTSCGLALLVTVGRWLEASAKERATAGLRAYLSDAARPARRVRAIDTRRDDEERVFADQLAVGDLVRVLPGEQVPADGVVASGRAMLDEAALTGEPLPRPVGPGDAVRAPALPKDGALVVRVERVGASTLLAQVGQVLDEARRARSPGERLADRIASVFVPAVLFLALAVFAWDLAHEDLTAASLHALSVLVVACPCALGIATPLAVTAALGQLASRGVLVRSGAALAELPNVTDVAFDKTGTLTEGRPEVGSVVARAGATREDALRLAASVEQGSESAWGRAILDAARAEGLEPWPCPEARVVPGRGIEGAVATDAGLRTVKVGSAAWLDPAAEHAPIVVAVDGVPVAEIHLADRVRADAREVVDALGAQGRRVCVLSGDAGERVRAVAAELGLPDDAVRGGLLPGQKVEAVRALRGSGTAVAFVGDGINDAPALAAADLGVAVGSGTDLARESAAVSLLGPDLTRIPALFEAARLTRTAVAWNLLWAFVYNVLAVTWAVVFGLPPVLAALAMVLSSLSVIGNSARLRTRLGALLRIDRSSRPGTRWAGDDSPTQWSP